MEGTEKQIQWAREIKNATIAKITEYEKQAVSDTDHAVIALIRSEIESRDDASWWIKYRNPLSRDLDFIVTYTLHLQPKIDAILKGK